MQYRIYRGQDGVMDYDHVQATMDLDDEDVAIPDQSLPANTIWHYIRRWVSDCDIESPDSDPTIVRIDSDGEMIPLTPNAPFNLQIEQVAGAKLRVRWRYSEIDQEIAPSDFYIYTSGSSEFNFEFCADSVSYYAGGNGEFEWTSAELFADLLWCICVRSYAEGAGESQNTNFVSAIADSGGPPAAANLAATWEED
jgi:hypothetical protein